MCLRAAKGHIGYQSHCKHVKQEGVPFPLAQEYTLCELMSRICIPICSAIIAPSRAPPALHTAAALAERTLAITRMVHVTATSGVKGASRLTPLGNIWFRYAPNTTGISTTCTGHMLEALVLRFLFPSQPLLSPCIRCLEPDPKDWKA